MSDVNRFGRIVTPFMVEQALVASLGLWMDDYLGELERIEGYDPGEIERPRSIITASEFSKWTEDQVPTIVVVNSGLAGKPERRGEGVTDAAWLVGVGPIVSDIDETETRKLSGAYVAAVRTAILQHKMLKSSLYPAGFANSLSWADEKYGEIPFNQSRTMLAGLVAFHIGVEGVVTEQAGPRVPSVDPGTDPGPWPSVTDIDVRLDPRPLTGVLP